MKVVVIGNGIAGFSAASTIRRLNEQCEITMIARETTPLYSACVLPDYISGKISRENTFVKTDKDYKELGIDTHFGLEVKEIDPIAKKINLAHAKVLSFDKLVLATGSEPIVSGEIKEGMFKIKTLKDADDILKHDGKKAVVIGSGPAAIETGIALFHRRYEVTIIARYNQILRTVLDLKAAGKLKSIIEEHGINIIYGERAEAVIGKEKVKALQTTNKEIECDTLVWAIGMQPRVDLARRSGIDIGDKGGIRVDSYMETNLPQIYACGDCVESGDALTGEQSLNLFWRNANRQGSVVARNVGGIPVEYPGSHKVSNLNILENHVVSFGYTEAALRKMKNGDSIINNASEVSVLEQEKEDSYYRLVIGDDRCLGAQFINIKQNIGLVWSIMIKRKRIRELVRIFENKDLICRRPWLYRVRPFFMPKPMKEETT